MVTSEKQLLYNRRWKDENREQQKLYRVNYRLLHIEERRAYQLIYNREHLAENNQVHKEWRRKNIEKTHLSVRRSLMKFRQNRRQQIISLLGGKCVHCGYNADVRALQFDHINGNGSAHRKAFYNPDAYYKHILSVNGDGFQLLCANCNVIKKAEKREYYSPNHQPEVRKSEVE